MSTESDTQIAALQSRVKELEDAMDILAEQVPKTIGLLTDKLAEAVKALNNLNNKVTQYEQDFAKKNGS